MDIKDDLTYIGFSTGWSAVRRMPEKAAYGLFNQVADRAWSKEGRGVKQLQKNLGRVLPDATDEEIREMSRESMRGYFRYWCDAFRMPDWSDERITNGLKIDGVDQVDAALAEGKGIIVALPHMGNWDHLGAWGSLNRAPVTAVAERLKPEKLFDRFVEYRGEIGMEIFPVGEPNLVERLSERLREGNRFVALVSDRDLSSRGVEVDFFGEKTKMPAGPAHLAMSTGATLLTATLWYEDEFACVQLSDKIRVQANEPIGPDAKSKPGYDKAIQRITQKIAGNFERGIRAHPTDWHMMQRLWLEDFENDDKGSKQ